MRRRASNRCPVVNSQHEPATSMGRMGGELLTPKLPVHSELLAGGTQLFFWTARRSAVRLAVRRVPVPARADGAEDLEEPGVLPQA